MPWVQYFEGAYALHTPTGTTCSARRAATAAVNIAPIDARRVFMWSDPPVPEGWHGVSSTDNKGTTVNVRY